MAQMYPASGPLLSRRDTTKLSKGELAEVAVYRALKKALKGEYRVFHSVHWVGIDELTNSVKTVNETDFVILHPQKGCMVIEVKSSGAKYKHGHFGSGALDPRQQVAWGQQRLAEMVRDFVPTLAAKRAATLSAASPYADIAGAMWFTDMTWAEMPDPALAEIILGKDELSRGLREKIERIYATRTLPYELTADEVERVSDLLDSMISLRPTLGRLFEDDRRYFLDFNEEQEQIFGELLAAPRCDVLGGAGTGKTILAFDVAWHLSLPSDDGAPAKRVLYLGSHRNQISWLRGDMRLRGRTTLGGLPPTLELNVYRALYKAIMTRAGEHFPETAPLVERLNRSIDILEKLPTTAPPWQFDAILADEAQDVAPELWEIFPRLLFQPATGTLHRFGDGRQSNLGESEDAL